MIRSLSIGRGAVRYHVGVVAEGFEPAGRWTGRGADQLGLSGPVTGASLGAVLKGVDPSTGRPLRLREAPVPGSELLFQVPKSVSILWGTADDQVADQVVRSATAALDASVGYLEAEALVVGRDRRPTGMVAASFLHRTSRLADPHLHVHLLVANLGQRDDGVWMAVDRLTLSAYVSAAGHLFEAHLRRELTARLGLSFGPVVNGVAQIEGIDASVRKAFSRRRGQVEDNAGRFGGSSAAARRLAALTDRPERHPGVAAEQLVEEWRARARSAGLDVASVLGRGRSVDVNRAGPESASGRGADRLDLDQQVLAELAELSSFSRRDVVKSACSLSPAGLAGADARAVVERVLSTPEVVSRDPVLRTSDVRRLVSGRVVVIGVDKARWTTRTELDRSRRLTELATSRPDAVVLMAGGRGPARDAALTDARRQWSSGGERVVGLAADVRSARRFESATGVDSSPYADVVSRLGVLSAPVVTPTVLLATNVERYGSRALLELAEVAARTGCRLVMVADDISFPDVDRAGGLRAVAEAIGTTRLGREGALHPVERELVYQVGERLAMSDSNEALRDRLVRDWSSGPGRPVMIATSRADVDDLNRRARALLAASGSLDGPERRVGGVEVRAGDRVVVSALDTQARRTGWLLGQEVQVVATGLEYHPPHRDGPFRGDDSSAGGVTFRYAYAATPYQASRRLGQATGDALVLGAPDAVRGVPARARYYVVADLADARALAAAVDRSEGRRWLAVARGAEIDPPAHLVAALGEPPRDAGERERWRAAAGAVERYRQRWDVTDERDALGPDAGGALRRTQRREALRLIERVSGARDVARTRTLGPGRELGGRGLESGIRDRGPALGA